MYDYFTGDNSKIDIKKEQVNPNHHKDSSNSKPKERKAIDHGDSISIEHSIATESEKVLTTDKSENHPSKLSSLYGNIISFITHPIVITTTLMSTIVLASPFVNNIMELVSDKIGETLSKSPEKFLEPLTDSIFDPYIIDEPVLINFIDNVPFDDIFNLQINPFS